MTTLLSAARVDFARSVKNSSAVLIVLTLINQEHPGHSTTADEVRDIIEMDVRTIGNHLRSLSARNLALYDGHGYVLLEENAMILGNTQALAQSPAQLQAPQAQALTEGMDRIPEAGESSQALEPDAHTACVFLEEEEVNLTIDSLTIDSSSSKSAQFVQPATVDKPVKGQPSTLQILEATELLWHKTMTLHGIEHKSRRAAIGWVAQAWDQRQHLRSPQGLIYARLSTDKLPQEKYYEHPRQYLPEEYLVHLGLMEPVTEEIPAEEPAPDYVDELENVVTVLSSEQFIPNPHEPVNAVQVWEQAKQQLREHVNKANFLTWVQPSKGLRFDGNSQTLIVLAGNPYTCAWLNERMLSHAVRAVSDLLGQTATVQFVTKGETL